MMDSLAHSSSWLIRTTHARRKLKDTDYPYAGPALGPKDRPQARRCLLSSSPLNSCPSGCALKPSVREGRLSPSWLPVMTPLQDIMIFIVGGATYEESKVVQALNVQAKREGAQRSLVT